MYQKGTAQAIGIVRPKADQAFGEGRIVRYAPCLFICNVPADACF